MKTLKTDKHGINKIKPILIVTTNEDCATICKMYNVFKQNFDNFIIIPEYLVENIYISKGKYIKIHN